MHEESARVDRRLRDETVGRRDAEEAREERRKTEESKIVVEPSGLAKGKLGSLRDQRLREADDDVPPFVGIR